MMRGVESLRRWDLWVVLLALAALPVRADHVPPRASADFDIDVIGCLAAAASAPPEFRTHLQSTCAGRMGAICDWGEGDTGGPRATACVDFETAQLEAYLSYAVPLLPGDLPLDGFAGASYRHGLGTLTETVAGFGPKPASKDFYEAADRAVVAMAGVWRLLHLVRRAGIELPPVPPSIAAMHKSDP